MLAVARHDRARFIVFVLLVRRGDAERHGGRPYGHVLVVTLGMDPLAGRREDEVTVEAIGAARLARRYLDVVREGREVPGNDDVLRMRRVGGGGKPAACERGVDGGDVTEHLRAVADREVDLRARALHPGGGPGVGEERREGACVAGGEREEGALELVGRVKAHRGLRRPGVQAQDQPKRERCRGDGG